MTVIRYEPWTLVNRLQRELDSFYRSPDAAATTPREPRRLALTPDVELQAEAERYVISADLPGVVPSDIEVTTEQGVLTIRATRGSATYLRSFTLPEDADTAAVNARSQHGVLELTIARQQKAQPRRINVEAA